MGEPDALKDPTAEVAHALLDKSVVSSVRAAYEKVLASRDDHRPCFRKWPFEQAELSRCVAGAVVSACEAGGAIRNLFSKRIIPKLARPPLVHEDDLCRAFVATMRTEMTHFDIAYSLFVGYVVDVIERPNLECHLSFCDHLDWQCDVETADQAERPLLARDYAGERQRLDELEELDALWSRNGLALKLEIDQTCRSSCGESAQVRVSPLRRLGLRLDGPIGDAALGMLSECLDGCSDIIAACIHPIPETLDRPALTIQHILSQRAVISEIVDCVLCSTPGGHDNLSDRINLAVRFMASAANQESTAISLALAVTALESLLGRKDGEIAKSLAERVAILMESRMEHRHQAEKFVQELYNHRSRVLHGEDIDSRAEVYRRARFLVLRVIYTLAHWRVFLRRSGEGEPLSRENLFDVIKQGKYGQSPFTGKLELDDVSAFLWAPTTPRRP